MKKKIAVICAMDIEAELLAAALRGAKEEAVGVMTFTRGAFGEYGVTVARCGVGKVFAAMCAEALILSFGPDLILNSGCAGSLDERLSVGDVCVPTGFVQYDMDTTALGDPPGFIGGGIDRVVLPTDENTASRLAALAAKNGLSAHRGLAATADRFVSSREEKKSLGKKLGALVCEMEGAALAQVAAAHGVPFCAIRSVSDSLTDGSAMEFGAFARLASEKSARLTLDFLSL